jgi:hypothetical protein
MLGPGELSLAAMRALAISAAAGKRRVPEVAAFLLDVDAQLIGLRRRLEAGGYRPGVPRVIRVRDPKPRIVTALPFPDRVAQHALIASTLPQIERRLVQQTYACRTGFGTHRALERAAEWTRRRGWVLRVDVRKFFPSVDHAILRRQLLAVTPASWRGLSDAFIDAPYLGETVAFHFPGDDLLTPMERPHGLPIGSLTSQIWANLFLSPIDHMLASHLGLGSFVRYCDDWLIWSDDPGKLRAALEAMRGAATRLRLRLHPGKSRLHRTTDPVPFLGFVLRRRGAGTVVRLREDNVRRFRRRAALMSALFRAGAIEVDEVRARVQAWLAHASHGHTRALVGRVLRDVAFSR